MDQFATFRTRTRHPRRPRSSDLIKRLFTDFRDYQARGSSLILGEGHYAGHTVYLVAQEKPKPENLRSQNDLARLNWGMLDADEHSQVLVFLRHLIETGPHEEALLLSLVDTYGADISMYSAQRLQAFFIAHLIHAYLRVPIRTISVVVGEGGSGGALALQVADRRAAFEDAMYATAPPESLAAIIFRDPGRLQDALAISKSTVGDLRYFRVVDTIIPQARQVADADAMAHNLGLYLDKAIKGLFRRKLAKLMDLRGKLAEDLGVIRPGSFYELKRFIERPLKQLQKAPPDIKLVAMAGISGGVHVADNYGDGQELDPGQPYLRCGEEREGDGRGQGCGALIPLAEYLAAHQVCPHCGRRHVLDAAGWINLLADPGSFHELFRNLTVFDLLPEEAIHAFYREFLARQKSSAFTEALVTGQARILGYRAVLAVCDFNFAGGSMGVVFGEKFRLAGEVALRRQWPLVSVCCSGGARLYEGIVALMQMTKTVATVDKLKRAGIPFISILADPSTGGAIASYAALGDVTLAEPGALVSFTGPRVMASRGFPVQEELVRSDSLLAISERTLTEPAYFGEVRGIQEVVARAAMRRTVAKYLEFYARTRQGKPPVKGERPYLRKTQPDLPPATGEER